MYILFVQTPNVTVKKKLKHRRGRTKEGRKCKEMWSPSSWLCPAVPAQRIDWRHACGCAGVAEKPWSAYFQVHHIILAQCMQGMWSRLR